jgi:hypothetical protein
MIAAVEDELSEAVLRRTLAVVRPDLAIWSVLSHRGSGYLRNRSRELNRTAAKVPVLVLTDLDDPAQCPPGLIADWLPIQRNPGLLIRVAVMEIESWVLAHRTATAPFLGVAERLIPIDTDGIPNPKEFLVGLARRSRLGSIRSDLVPRKGSTAHVGPAYNATLSQFVAAEWDPRAASKHSESLARTIDRLKNSFC